MISKYIYSMQCLVYPFLISVLLRWSESGINKFKHFPFMLEKCTFPLAISTENFQEYFTSTHTISNETHNILNICILSTENFDFQQVTLNLQIDSTLYNIFSGQSKKVLKHYFHIILFSIFLFSFLFLMFFFFRQSNSIKL